MKKILLLIIVLTPLMLEAQTHNVRSVVDGKNLSFFRGQEELNVSLSGQFNVMDYGAVGNGTTDDAAAIQSCINAAGVGGTVYFPDKSYRINSTLNILNNQKLLLTTQ